MKFNRAVAAGVGLLSVYPLLYLIAFTTYLMPKLYTLVETASGDYAQAEHLFDITIVLHGATIIFTLSVLALFGAFVYKSDAVPVSKRSLWIALLLLGNIVAMPVFWYLYVWRRSPSPPT